MKFNRKYWDSFKVGKPCHFCEVGVVIPVEKKGIYKTPMKSTTQTEFPQEIFIGFFECVNCFQRVSVSGKVENIQGFDQAHNEYIDQNFYSDLYFYPSLPIIQIPKSTPKEISELVEISFKLFWIDYDSCGNKIRASLEVLMDHLKVKKTFIRKGKREKASLGYRIGIYKSKNESLSSKIKAVKWIGNAGTHNDKITKEQVLDGYEILELILDELFSKKEKRIEKVVKKINKKKKPI